MFEQVKLSYGFSELEPYIDALTMETHYTKHHAAYTKNFSAAAEQAGWQNKPIEEILSHLEDITDTSLQAVLRNNGGGFYNHNLYFSTLTPKGQGKPEGDFEKQISRQFGSFEALQEKLSSAAMAQFGSGWAWLSTNVKGEMCISQSANQDNPIMLTKGEWKPILGVDVWEHAYYLKYKNLRADYIKALFHVIDWKQVEQNFNQQQSHTA